MGRPVANRIALLACLLGFAACTAAPPMPAPPPTHPASPLAEQAPEPVATDTLRMAPTASTPTAPARAPKAGH